jgi:preprotein translocase subunit YajC
MEAIVMMCLAMAIAIGGVIYFTVRDRKEAKRAKQLKAE